MTVALRPWEIIEHAEAERRASAEYARWRVARPTPDVSLNQMADRAREARELAALALAPPLDLRGIVRDRFAALQTPTPPLQRAIWSIEAGRRAAIPQGSLSASIGVVQPPPANWRAARQLRHRLARTSRGLAKPQTGTRYCGRKLHMRSSSVEVYTRTVRDPAGKAGAETMAYTSGIFRCGNLWACPTCAATIQRAYRNDVRAAVKAHRQATATPEWRNGAVYMLTLTLKHNRAMPLDATREAVTEAWRAFVNGKPWKKLQARLGVVGWVRALEATHGEESGWHPHLHVLLLCDAVWGQAAAREHARALFDRWRSMLRANGKRAARYGIIEPEVWDTTAAGAESPLTGGVDVRLCDTMNGEYLVKLGIADEVASGAYKVARVGNRSPLQILGDYATTRAPRDRKLWLEFARTMKGRRALTWSRGLRAKYLLPPEQAEIELAYQTDATERAGDPDAAALCAVVSSHAWSVIARACPSPELQLCEAAEVGGYDGVLGEVARLAWYALREERAPRIEPPHEKPPWVVLADALAPEVKRMAPPRIADDLIDHGVAAGGGEIRERVFVAKQRAGDDRAARRQQKARAPEGAALRAELVRVMCELGAPIEPTPLCGDMQTDLLH